MFLKIKSQDFNSGWRTLIKLFKAKRSATLGMVLPGGRATDQTMLFAYLYSPRTLTFDPNSTPTHPDRVFRKPNVLLAEFEQNLFKHKHWPSTSKDGESLSGKQGIGNPSHGGSKQGFNCTLRGEEKIIPESTAHLQWAMQAYVQPQLSSPVCLASHLLVFRLSKSDVYTA